MVNNNALASLLPLVAATTWDTLALTGALTTRSAVMTISLTSLTAAEAAVSVVTATDTAGASAATAKPVTALPLKPPTNSKSYPWIRSPLTRTLPAPTPAKPSKPLVSALITWALVSRPVKLTRAVAVPNEKRKPPALGPDRSRW